MTPQEREEIRAYILSFSTKISDLPEVSSLQDGDYVTVVQDDGSKKHSKKATLESLLQLIKVHYPDNNGAKYQGIAHPTDNNVTLPIGTDGFWFAIDAGTYTNYGNIQVGNSPKVIHYNVITHEWSSDDLWGDINGTVEFPVKINTSDEMPELLYSVITGVIPVIKDSTYNIKALPYPASAHTRIAINEYGRNDVVIDGAYYNELEQTIHTLHNTDYIKVGIGYLSSNPIDPDNTYVELTAPLRPLVEALYKYLFILFGPKVLKRLDDAEDGLAALQRELNILSARVDVLGRRVGTAESNIISLDNQVGALRSDITDIEGNISSIYQDIDEIDFTVSSIDGRTSALEIRADGIDATVRNINGDIASLQLTTLGLEVNVRSVQGDVSTLQVQASEISARVENIDGEVADISIRADAIEQTVENQQGQISQLSMTAQQIELSVQEVSTELHGYENYVAAVISDIQDQIDGAIDTWFYDYMPVHTDATGAPDSQDPLVYITVGGQQVPCQPYYDWYMADAGGTSSEVNTERLKHLGDIFYDNKSGYAFRFSNSGTSDSPVFIWVEITDSAVIKALRDAAKAQDTADHKRRVFVTNPYVPYDEGDLWVKPVMVGSTNTTELYKCIVAKNETQTADLVNDWAPADGYGYLVNKTNLQLLADAIVGTVSSYQYNSDGTLSSSTQSLISQQANDIVLQISGTELATVGIYIHSSAPDVNHITLQSDKVYFQGTGSHNPTLLAVEWNSTTNRYELSASNLSIGYLADALDKTTVIQGGLILSTAILLGDNTGIQGAWEPWAGMSGDYDTTQTGYGLAAWYGGSNVDYETLTDQQKQQGWAVNRWAKTAFRMDGSGYIANGAISWGAAGDLHLLDNVYIGPNMDKTLASISTFVTLLSTWFEDDTIVINGVSKHVLRINMSGDTHDTGFAGVVWNGFLITHGDQIINSGTPGGGGGGGGASYLYELYDFAASITAKPTTQKILVFNPTGTDKNSNNGAWEYADLPTGSVNAISVNNNTYNPVSGVITLPDYPVVPTSVSAFTNDAGYLTSHQTVTLVSGTNNGTLKITTASGTVDNIAVQGLGSLAYKSSLIATDIPDLSGLYLPLSGGELSGSLEIHATGSSWSEGVRIHAASNGWSGIILCDSANTGHTGTSANTWGMHNHEGVFGFYKNGSDSSASAYFYFDAAGKASISGDMQIQSVEIGHNNEINSIGNNALYLNYRTNQSVILADGGGYVGVKGSPSYPLHVYGGSQYQVICLQSSTTEASIIFNANGSVWGAGVGLWGQTNNFVIGDTSAWRMKVDSSGTLTTTGDQVVNSDKTLKKNLQDLKYTVEDIAKAPAVTFDWKNKEGHSFGSIAQYWKPICPEMVHGIEGQYSIAYAQGAFVNAVLLAREVVELRKRIKELEEKLS